jgi:hypothetical protein
MELYYHYPLYTPKISLNHMNRTTHANAKIPVAPPAEYMTIDFVFFRFNHAMMKIKKQMSAHTNQGISMNRSFSPLPKFKYPSAMR